MSTISSPQARSPSLEALETEWQELWRKARGSPFQSPAWLLPWWQHIGRSELACAVVRDPVTDELIGFAPLYVYRDPQGLRHLFPLGISTTDHIDALGLPGREDEVGQAIVAHVRDLRPAWDVFEVPQLRRNALLLRCRWPAAWRRELRECEAHPVLALPAQLPASLGRSIAYSHRRAQRDADLTFEIAHDAKSVSGMLEELAALHAKRWARRDLPGVLGEQGVLDWHREAAPRLLAQGMLRLIALRLGERIIGVAYGLADAAHLPRRRWYFYIGGFDPGFSVFSPGSMLIDYAVERAAAEGAMALDFLRGAEAYKYRWGAVDEPMFALRICAPSV